MRGLSVALAVFFYLDLIIQLVGLMFFDTPALRTGLAAFTGLVFGSLFLALVLNSRRVDALRRTEPSR